MYILIETSGTKNFNLLFDSVMYAQYFRFAVLVSLKDNYHVF